MLFLSFTVNANLNFVVLALKKSYSIIKYVFDYKMHFPPPKVLVFPCTDAFSMHQLLFLIFIHIVCCSTYRNFFFKHTWDPGFFFFWKHNGIKVPWSQQMLASKSERNMRVFPLWSCPAMMAQRGMEQLRLLTCKREKCLEDKKQKSMFWFFPTAHQKSFFIHVCLGAGG